MLYKTPFGREQSMVPLSRDHGVLLVLVQRLRKAGAGKAEDRKRLVSEIRTRLAGLVEKYLYDETDALLSVTHSPYIRAEIETQHATITLAVKRLGSTIKSRQTPDRFFWLADLIEEHVRWDERMLLPYLQNDLSPSERNTLSQLTSVLESQHARPTRSRHHSIDLDKHAGKAQTCTCADSVKADK